MEGRFPFPLMTWSRRFAPWCCLALLQAPSLVSGADAKLTARETDFFETKIRPVLSENCYKCHSKNSEKVKGGLLLDSRDGVLKGGNTGPAVVPGRLEKSLLIQAVHYKDKDLQMPPSSSGGKLSDNLGRWKTMIQPPEGKTVEDIAKALMKLQKAS